MQYRKILGKQKPNFYSNSSDLNQDKKQFFFIIYRITKSRIWQMNRLQFQNWSCILF